MVAGVFVPVVTEEVDVVVETTVVVACDAVVTACTVIDCLKPRLLCGA